MLQNLTHADIEHFVKQRLTSNLAFKGLAARDEASTSALISEIVNKADGVFLWIRLVVKSLLNGIRNRDSIIILRERVRSTPQELEHLYGHLLGLIEPLYLAWASKAFQIVRLSRNFEGVSGLEPLTLEVFSLAMQEEQGEHRRETLNRLKNELLRFDYEEVNIHLTARCAGLLECSSTQPLQVSGASTVGYLHATARNCMESKSFWSKILEHTQGARFNPYVSLLKAYAVLGKPSSALIYGHQIDWHFPESKDHIVLLDYLDDTLSAYDNNGSKGVFCYTQDWHWSNNLSEVVRTPNPLTCFLDLATIYQLRRYVKSKLESENQHPVASSLLHRLLWNTDYVLDDKLPLPCAEMASLLLNSSANPNQRFNELSAWEATLSYLLNYTLVQKRRWGLNLRMVLAYLPVAKLLLSAGANPRARVFAEDWSGVFSVVEIMEGLKPRFPQLVLPVLEELHGQLARTN